MRKTRGGGSSVAVNSKLECSQTLTDKRWTAMMENDHTCSLDKPHSNRTIKNITLRLVIKFIYSSTNHMMNSITLSTLIPCNHLKINTSIQQTNNNKSKLTKFHVLTP